MIFCLKSKVFYFFFVWCFKECKPVFKSYVQHSYYSILSNLVNWRYSHKTYSRNFKDNNNIIGFILTYINTNEKQKKTEQLQILIFNLGTIKSLFPR
jgi:hypothetical protein